MDGESLRRNPKTLSLAAQGVPWAVKLVSSGWSSLKTNQKRLARATVGSAMNTPSTIVPRRPRVQRPPVKGDRNGPGQAGKSMTLTKTEFLGNVVSNIGEALAVRKWVINPRNVDVFRDTSLLSLNFNKYRIVTAQFRYVPACSFETNGRVMLGFNDDASDRIPSNKGDFYGLKHHAETAAQTPLSMNLPIDGKTRFMMDSTSDDPKLVDFGTLMVGRTGFDKDQLLVGEVFLHFTIVLSDPTFTNQISQEWDGNIETGPKYVDVVQGKDTVSVTFRQPGRWNLILSAANGQMTKPTVPEGAEGTVRFSDDVDGALCFVTLETYKEMVTLTSSTIAPGVRSWWVSRA